MCAVLGSQILPSQSSQAGGEGTLTVTGLVGVLGAQRREGLNLPEEAGRTFQGSLGNSWVAPGAGNAQGGPVGERVADPNQKIARKGEAIACSILPSFSAQSKGQNSVLFRFEYLTFKPVRTSFFLCSALQNQLP